MANPLDIIKGKTDMFSFGDTPTEVVSETTVTEEEQETLDTEKEHERINTLKRRPIINGARIESYSVLSENGEKYFIPVYDTSLKIPFNLSSEDVRDYKKFFDAFYRSRGVPFKFINIPTRERYKKDVNERGVKVTREFFKFGINGHNIEIKIGFEPIEVPEPIYDMLIKIFKEGDIVERKIKAKALASGIQDTELELIGSKR